MKNLLLSIVLLIPFCLAAQSSAIDNLFEKYQNRDGFTSIDINSSLFSVLSEVENDKDLKELARQINGIKILVAEEPNIKELNFYNEVIDELNENNYQELMVIKNSDVDLKMMIKSENKKISEFILLVGGDDDNALIYITGDIKLSDLAKMDNFMNVDGMTHLRKLENMN